MNNFLNEVLSYKDVELVVTNKMRIQQKDQTKIKRNLTDALLTDMREAGLDVYETQKGFILVIENSIEGGIPIEVNLIMKSLDHDYIALNEEYFDKLNKK